MTTKIKKPAAKPAKVRKPKPPLCTRAEFLRSALTALANGTVMVAGNEVTGTIVFSIQPAPMTKGAATRHEQTLPYGLLYAGIGHTEQGRKRWRGQTDTYFPSRYAPMLLEEFFDERTIRTLTHDFDTATAGDRAGLLRRRLKKLLEQEQEKDRAG